MKNGVIRTVIILGSLLLFVGVVVIQSSGIFKTQESGTISTDLSQPGGNRASDSSVSAQPPGMGGAKDLKNSTIIPFLERLNARYPVLLQLGRQMGFNKKSASNVISQFGNDNLVRAYLLILSKMLNL